MLRDHYTSSETYEEYQGIQSRDVLNNKYNKKEVRLETIQITSCTIEKYKRSCEESSYGRRKVLNEIVLSQVSITFEHLTGTRGVVL